MARTARSETAANAKILTNVRHNTGNSHSADIHNSAGATSVPFSRNGQPSAVSAASAARKPAMRPLGKNRPPNSFAVTRSAPMTVTSRVEPLWKAPELKRCALSPAANAKQEALSPPDMRTFTKYNLEAQTHAESDELRSVPIRDGVAGFDVNLDPLVQQPLYARVVRNPPSAVLSYPRCAECFDVDLHR
jgi:hypothetical protein